MKDHELAALIAEKVMGWTEKENEKGLLRWVDSNEDFQRHLTVWDPVGEVEDHAEAVWESEKMASDFFGDGLLDYCHKRALVEVCDGESPGQPGFDAAMIHLTEEGRRAFWTAWAEGQGEHLLRRRERWRRAKAGALRTLRAAWERENQK